MGKRRCILMIMYGKAVGGAELQFIELANYLANSYQVRLVSLGGGGALISAQVDSRIEVRVYQYSDPVNTILKLSRAFIANLAYPSRHIVTTAFIANLLGWAIGLFRKRRLVSLQTVSKCVEHRVMDRFVLQRFDALIAGAVDIKDYLISNGQDPSRIHVIHNWVDFSKRKQSASVQKTREKLCIGDHQKIIGCIGRLHPQKGQIYLIRAFAIVIVEFPKAMLLLVGDGETRDEIKKEVSLLGLDEMVVFTGTVTGDEYNNFLAAIDIYVQPSVFEGLPRTLLDAMYMGKAIVATNINGNREAIENDVSGILVPSENPDNLSSAILMILRNSELKLKLSTSASEAARSKFSMVNQMIKLEDVINGG